MIIKQKKLAPQGKRYPTDPHKGDLIECIVITHPDTIFWLAERDPWPGFQWFYDHIQKLVDLFDAKPFTNCSCAGKIDGQPCTRPVTRFSLYKGQSVPVFWCAECDHLQLGANSGKVEVHEKYYDGLRFLKRNNANRVQQQNLIRRLAEAKGLTGNVTEKKALEFFYGAPSEASA